MRRRNGYFCSGSRWRRLRWRASPAGCRLRTEEGRPRRRLTGRRSGCDADQQGAGRGASVSDRVRGERDSGGKGRAQRSGALGGCCGQVASSPALRVVVLLLLGCGSGAWLLFLALLRGFHFRYPFRFCLRRGLELEHAFCACGAVTSTVI
jgi:hypothetical protein